MTLEDITKLLNRIEKCKRDDEAAHSLQDQLFEDVLEAISLGADNPSMLAKEALKVLNIDFERWCA